MITNKCIIIILASIVLLPMIQDVRCEGCGDKYYTGAGLGSSKIKDINLPNISITHKPAITSSIMIGEHFWLHPYAELDVELSLSKSTYKHKNISTSKEEVIHEIHRVAHRYRRNVTPPTPASRNTTTTNGSYESMSTFIDRINRETGDATPLRRPMSYASTIPSSSSDESMRPRTPSPDVPTMPRPETPPFQGAPNTPPVTPARSTQSRNRNKEIVIIEERAIESKTMNNYSYNNINSKTRIYSADVKFKVHLTMDDNIQPFIGLSFGTHHTKCLINIDEVKQNIKYSKNMVKALYGAKINLNEKFFVSIELSKGNNVVTHLHYNLL